MTAGENSRLRCTVSFCRGCTRLDNRPFESGGLIKQSARKASEDMKTAKAPLRRLNEYRKVLLARKTELSSSLRTKLETLSATGGAALEDMAPVFSDQFTALRINRLDYLQLKLVEAALARIDSEEYGLCTDCGSAIPSSRLDAIPWAARCIACQELFSSDNDSGFPDDSAQLEEMSA